MGMIPLKCPTCGADIQLDEGREFGFCNYCGTKIMQEKIVVEHKGDVKVNNAEFIANIRANAKQQRKNGNTELAQKYYEQLLMYDANDWEANFYTVYYQTANCKVGEIALAAERLTESEKSVLELINTTYSDEEEKRNALGQMLMDLISISDMLYHSAKSHHDSIPSSIRSEFLDEYLLNCVNSTFILYAFGENVETIFGKNYSNIFILSWETAINQHKDWLPEYYKTQENKDCINTYVKKVQKYDKDYKTPDLNALVKRKKAAKGGCYVATAVYGSYDCPEVWTLRRYRDYSLALTWYGRLFIALYYAISPTIVKWFGNTNWFNKMWKGRLDKMVKRLQEEGFENTPYEDKNW